MCVWYGYALMSVAMIEYLRDPVWQSFLPRWHNAATPDTHLGLPHHSPELQLPSYSSQAAAFRRTESAPRHPDWPAELLVNTNVCLTSISDISSLSYRATRWTMSSLNFNGAQPRQYLHITICKHHQWPQQCHYDIMQVSVNILNASAEIH